MKKKTRNYERSVKEGGEKRYIQNGHPTLNKCLGLGGNVETDLVVGGGKNQLGTFIWGKNGEDKKTWERK